MFGLAIAPPARRARRGARFLDKQDPAWPTKIDQEKLDIACAKNCVLGQLYGSYADGWRKLPEGQALDIVYGFAAPSKGDPVRYYGLLNAAWQRETQKRLRRQHPMAA